MWWRIFAWFLHCAVATVLWSKTRGSVYLWIFDVAIFGNYEVYCYLLFNFSRIKTHVIPKNLKEIASTPPFWHTAPVDADQIIHPLNNRRLKWWINVVWAAHDNLCGRVVVNGSRQINHVYACFTMSTPESTGMQNDQLTTTTTRWMCNSISAVHRESDRRNSKFWHKLLITYICDRDVHSPHHIFCNNLYFTRLYITTSGEYFIFSGL